MIASDEFHSDWHILALESCLLGVLPLLVVGTPSRSLARHVDSKRTYACLTLMACMVVSHAGDLGSLKLARAPLLVIKCFVLNWQLTCG